MGTSRTLAAAAATAALALALVVAPPSAARAKEPVAPAAGAPVTRADHVTVAADSGSEIDVLANDTDPDATTNQDLEICRLESFADLPIDVYPSTGYDYDTGGHPVLHVFASNAKPGTYAITYYVCDYDYLTPATLTVKVTAPQNPFAEVLTARPGYVRFHNPGNRRTVIRHGSRDGRTIDGKFALAPHTAKTVRIKRRAIQWTATVRTPHGSSSRGNILTGIKQPDSEARAISNRPIMQTQADRTAWRLGTRHVELLSARRSTRPVALVASRDESTDAPLTAPDEVEVSQGFFGLADVLKNDSDPDGATDDLAICRASAPARSGLTVTPIAGDSFIILSAGRGRATRTTAGTVDPLPYNLLVQAGAKTPLGTYDVTYYACDRQYLTPNTVTVTVTKSQMIIVRKLKERRGVVRFTNPGPHAARIEVRNYDWAQGHAQRPPLLARFELPAHTSKNFRPHVRTILWSATSRRGPSGTGVVSGIGRAPQH